MREVVIAGYLRTAQSRSRPNKPEADCFYRFRSDELLAKLLPEVVGRAGIQPSDVDDFVVGSALGVGEQWSFGGRTPLFLADFPASVSAKFVDQQCGSSMACVHVGFLEIASGTADVVLLGGVEHMTRVPMGRLLGGGSEAVVWNRDLFEAPQYGHWDLKTATNMGLTAEALARQDGQSREDQDHWALRAHQLAARAQAEGFFSGEILPIETSGPDGAPVLIDRDQAVRPETSLEGLAELRPAFLEGGVVTAGNASPLNAGASAMVLMAREEAERRGVRPLAAVRSIGFAGVEPALMGTGPVPASRKALRQAGLREADVDFWEINEAFCAVVLHCMKELGLDPERVNVKGGGTALGHALGATGIRLVGTLARILREKGARYGCATACCGGGQGVATVIEAI
ncbi:MAG: acetyl-CoA C-acetyltransferase [Deltaproteobacteria bacterium]|nr:acetyl-CoA C-acetyltransferase [Deltaproteobacteria bacterium]